MMKTLIRNAVLFVILFMVLGSLSETSAIAGKIGEGIGFIVILLFPVLTIFQVLRKK